MIAKIREKIASDQFEFSEHAVGQSIIRRISVQELREAVANGEFLKTTLMTNMDQAVLYWASLQGADLSTFNAVTPIAP